MTKVIGFGETLLRLKAPGNERLLQSQSLEATFGGAELNVVASLARFGVDTAYVTVLPDHGLGDAAVADIRKYGLGTQGILRTPGRLGLYFLEAGSDARAAKIIYDRANSALAAMPPEQYGWDKLLAGGTWLHVTGITPALSPYAAKATADAVTAARKSGMTVSLDVNFRRHLWQASQQSPQDVLLPLLANSTVLLASAEDCETCFGINVPDALTDPVERFAQAARQLLDGNNNLELVATTFRSGKWAHQSTLQAAAVSRQGMHVTRTIDINEIVDRIGAGDAFAAGLIYGRIQNWPLDRTLNFALAAGVLKHTFPGDINLATLAEVEAMAAGQPAQRVDR